MDKAQARISVHPYGSRSGSTPRHVRHLVALWRILPLCLLMRVPALAGEPTAPATLAEAHLQLERELPKEELARIDTMKSEDEMIIYHRGLGMGIRNGWGLWKGGPLAQHMRGLGFTHPDDMSGTILETFWCKRHGQDFRLKERAEYYARYWKGAADPPKTARDPGDGSEIRWEYSFGFGDDHTPRQVHIGKSKKSGRWLAYEYDKGVYVPGKDILDRIAENEKGIKALEQTEIGGLLTNPR